MLPPVPNDNLEYVNDKTANLLLAKKKIENEKEKFINHSFGSATEQWHGRGNIGYRKLVGGSIGWTVQSEGVDSRGLLESRSRGRSVGRSVSLIGLLVGLMRLERKSLRWFCKTTNSLGREENGISYVASVGVCVRVISWIRMLSSWGRPSVGRPIRVGIGTSISCN